MVPRRSSRSRPANLPLVHAGGEEMSASPNTPVSTMVITYSPLYLPQYIRVLGRFRIIGRPANYDQRWAKAPDDVSSVKVLRTGPSTQDS